MSLLIGKEHRQILLKRKARKAHCNFAGIGPHGWPDPTVRSRGIPLSADVRALFKDGRLETFFTQRLGRYKSGGTTANNGNSPVAFSLLHIHVSSNFRLACRPHNKTQLQIVYMRAASFN